MFNKLQNTGTNEQKKTNSQIGIIEKPPLVRSRTAQYKIFRSIGISNNKRNVIAITEK